MKREQKPKEPQKPGPKPDDLVLDGPWEEAIKTALGKKRPAEGWPKPTKKNRGK